MATKEYKRTRGVPPAKIPSKLCIRCNQVKPLTDFYTNRQWKDQAYRDAWCKDCVAKYAVDKDSVREYCEANNRKFTDSFWEAAERKAQYVVATDPDYLKAANNDKLRATIMNKTIARQFFKTMNMAGIYHYTDHQGLDDDAEQKAEEEEKQRLVYSKVWKGKYTQEVLDEFEEEYARYANDFVLDNVNIEDYTRKIIKLSHDVNVAEERFRRGEISSKELKEIHDLFDSSSKSANFAACRRQPGDGTGTGSLGEIAMRVELAREIKVSDYDFPKDQIDDIMEDFYHTFEATGKRGVFDGP